MKRNKHIAVIMRISIFLVFSLLWMYVIYMFSENTGEKSQNQSDFIVNIICGLFGLKPDAGMTGTLSYIVRKAAHFTEYAVLGFFYLQEIAAWQSVQSIVNDAYRVHKANHRFACELADKKNKFCLCTATVLCMVYACTDEFHQSFTDGRNPSVFDVVIDTAGGFFGALLGLAVLYIIIHKTGKEGTDNDSR